VARVNPVLISASPPCKKYSTSDMQKRSGAEDMIALTRDSCEQTGRLYVLENVKGAAEEMRDHALLLYGSYFELRVDRPRFYEANFDLRLDEYLRGPGLDLRARGCVWAKAEVEEDGSVRQARAAGLLRGHPVSDAGFGPDWIHRSRGRGSDGHRGRAHVV
jgi:hypothetical protein